MSNETETPTPEESSVDQTETPRTDAAEPQLQSNKGGWVRADFARELERELAASQEAYLKSVERDDYLTRELAMWDYGTRAKRERERAEKAEAAVERLKKANELSNEVWRRFTEIRAALGDDGRRTHKEILELAAKASQCREWKEKYIALKNAHIAEGQDPSGTIWEHADKLQKELKASKAEVERLRERVKELESALLRVVSTPVLDPAKILDLSLGQLWDSIADAQKTLYK